METVEVLVRIPKRDFEELQGNYVWWGKHGEYIKKGTILPKGHGRLIETDELISHLKAHENLLVRHYADEDGDIPFFEINSRIDQIRTCIDDIVNAPTVIEADKAESEG